MNNKSTSGVGGGGAEAGSVVTEQVRQSGQQVVDGAQQAAGQVATQAKQQVQSVFSSQQSQITQTLQAVHDGLHQTGETLRQQNQSAAAGAVDKLADGLNGVSTYVGQRDLGQLVDDVEGVARRNSALFLGGAFALGVLAARFLKSSTPQTYSQYGSAGAYQSYQSRSYGYRGRYEGPGYSSRPGYDTSPYISRTASTEEVVFDEPAVDSEVELGDGTLR